MASLGTATLVTRMDLSGLKAGFSQAESLSKQGLTKISADFTRIGRNMSLAVTAPLTLMGRSIVKLSSDFEKSMNRVSALSSATGGELEKLTGLARQLGADTQFSASEAADAMSFLAMAGFEVTQIYDSMPGTLNLAAAAQLDMGTAADIVSNIMTGFGIATEDLGTAVDVLSKAFISSNTDLQMLGEGMKYVGPIASGLGVSIEETTAALGSLSNAGIQGSMAGTSLRRILSTLASDADKLGISAYDASGQMRPLADIIDELNKRGMTTAETLEVFGDRGGPAMQALLSQGGQALRDFTGELENAGGTAERVATTQMAGLHGLVKELESAAEEAMLALGDAGLNEIIKSATLSLTNLIRGFNELPEGVRKATLVIGGLATAIGPLLLGLGAIVKTLPLLAAGFALLTGPAGWITLAVVGVGALALSLSGRQDSLDTTIENATTAAGQATAGLQDMAVETGNAQDAVEKLTEATDEDGLRGAMTAMASTLEGEAKEAFVTLAEQAIATGGDIEEVAGKLMAVFAEMRQASLESKVAQLQDLFEVAEAAAILQRSAYNAVAGGMTGGNRVGDVDEFLQNRQTLLDQALMGAGHTPGALQYRTTSDGRLEVVATVPALTGSSGNAAVPAGAISDTVFDTIRTFNEDAGELDEAAQELQKGVQATAEAFNAIGQQLSWAQAQLKQNEMYLEGRADSPFLDMSATITPGRRTTGSGTPPPATPPPGPSTQELQEQIDLAVAAAIGRAAASSDRSGYTGPLYGGGAPALNTTAIEIARDTLDAMLQSGLKFTIDEVNTAIDSLSRHVPLSITEIHQLRAALVSASEDAVRAFDEFPALITPTGGWQPVGRAITDGIIEGARERATQIDFGSPFTQNSSPRGSATDDVEAANFILRDTVEALVAAGAPAEQINEALEALTRRVPMTTAEINELTGGLHKAETATSSLVKAFDEFPVLDRSAITPLGLSPSQLAFGDQAGLLSQQLGRRASRDGDGGLSEAQRIAREQQMAADSFAETVVDASFGFTDGLISAIRSGDLTDAFSAAIRAGQSIVGGMTDLPSIPFLGGNIGVGSLISGGLGIIGRLVGLFSGIGGSSREREQAAERERQLARSTPAININATVNQTNNLNGGLMDPRTQVELDNRTRSIVAEVLDQIGIQQYLNPAGGTS